MAQQEVARNFSDLHTPNQPMPLFLVAYVVIFGLSAIVGSVGNILVIVTVLFDKKLRQTKNSFILSLAVADFWVSSVTMPASITGVVVGRQWFEDNKSACAFTSTVCAPACIASVYSIAWIAVHRYFYIGQYSLCLEYFNLPRMVLYVTATWIFSFAVHLPNHFGWGQTRYSFMLRFCSIDTDLLSYAVFYAVMVLLALFVAFAFYVKIYRLLRSTNLAKRLIINGKKSLACDNPNRSSSSKLVFGDFVFLPHPTLNCTLAHQLSHFIDYPFTPTISLHRLYVNLAVGCNHKGNTLLKGILQGFQIID